MRLGWALATLVFGAGAAEGAGIPRGVGQVQDGAVDAHQPEVAVERPRRLATGQRAGDPVEEARALSMTR